MSTESLGDEAYALGPPTVRGRARAAPEDFQVEEQLGFVPDGAGEHVFLQIRKRNANTDWLARQLARIAGVRPGEVSYAGLKDRHAVTTQWFSVQLPGREMPDWSGLLSDDVQLLTAVRNSRKLRRGALRGNRFTIVLRDLRGDMVALAARLTCVAAQGVPNYFGTQRFGHDGGNLDKAAALFAGSLKVRDRHVRGLYLSAARSHLFNRVLSQRIADGTWNAALPGEAMMLEGTHSVFVTDVIDAAIAQRVNEFDIHPTGPLWGRGSLLARDAALALETAALAPFSAFRLGLENAGLAQERRALRVRVMDLVWEFPAADVLQVRFQLPAGSYATSVLRELIDTPPTLDCGVATPLCREARPAAPLLKR